MADLIFQILNYLALVVLIITIGCKISPRCLYYTKVTTIYIGLLYMGIVLSFYGLFHKSYQTSRMAKTLLDPIGKLLNINYRVEGKELIDNNKAYIVIANHQHALDIVSLMQIWDAFQKIAVIAKYELKWAGPFGIAAQLGGTVFVQRSKAEKAKLALNKALKDAKDTKTSLHIFPEGTRHLASLDGVHMLPFKKGAFHMAIDTGFPILPVVISEYNFIDQRHKTFGSSGNQDVTITVLNPIETNEMSKDDIDRLIEDTRNKMVEVFKDKKTIKIASEENKHIKSE